MFGVDGAARYACRVPGQDWIEEGADARERLERNARYNRGMECLKATEWHSTASEMLPKAALAFPCLALAAYLFRVLRRGGALKAIDHPGIAYGAVFTGTLLLTMLPIFAAMWFFQHYGFPGP